MKQKYNVLQYSLLPLSARVYCCVCLSLRLSVCVCISWHYDMSDPRYREQQWCGSTRWPLVWKTWKCRGMFYSIPFCPYLLVK